MFSVIVLIIHSLSKSEQKISEVLKELNVSETREKVVLETMKINKATFEEATKRLEGRVSSLETELIRSRESYVAQSIFGLDVPIPSQRYTSKHAVTGMEFELHYAESDPGLLDNQTGTARPARRSVRHPPLNKRNERGAPGEMVSRDSWERLS